MSGLCCFDFCNFILMLLADVSSYGGFMVAFMVMVLLVGLGFLCFPLSLQGAIP